MPGDSKCLSAGPRMVLSLTMFCLIGMGDFGLRMAEFQVLIGIAMQAEHDSLETRRLAPSLAIFRDDRLDVISTGTDALGYGADISAAPDGGFCVSSNRARKMLWWRPNSDQSLSIIATIEEPYALCKDAKSTNVYLACAWGVARWQPKQAQLLPWPEPMVLDNHWSLMSTTPNA
ncbi:MAG: DUF1513 domain-containing protein [Betaproteobacteria bacterium]|nr:DUF1513 domain-containing protein [Betaproteobacteria bacterium]